MARQSLGFALVMVNLPFARILWAVFRGGNDEMYVLSKFMAYPATWALGGAGATAAGAGLGGRAWPWIFLAFFLLPFPVAAVLLLGP